MNCIIKLEGLYRLTRVLNQTKGYRLLIIIAEKKITPLFIKLKFMNLIIRFKISCFKLKIFPLFCY